MGRSFTSGGQECRIKEAICLKGKCLLYSCLLIVGFPSGSSTLNWKSSIQVSLASHTPSMRGVACKITVREQGTA